MELEQEMGPVRITVDTLKVLASFAIKFQNVQKPENWISWYQRLTMVMGIVMAEFECCHQQLMGFDKVDMDI